MNFHCQDHQGCNRDDNCWIGRKKKGESQSDKEECGLQAIIELVILEVTLVKITICKDSSLKEADTRKEEAGRKEVMGFRVYQETHRHSHHNQANKNRIVAVYQKDTLILSFFINGVLLKKVSICFFECLY